MGSYSPPLQALDTVLEPGVRAEGAVLSQLDPLLAELTEYPSRLDLAQKRVRT